MNTARLEKYLQREVGDPKLRLMWDNTIERFIVGRLVESLSCDYIEWFYVVTDGNSNFRPIDMRTVRKIKSLDTWARDKTLSVKDFAKQIEKQRLERDEERSTVMRYRLKHEARYIKRMAEKDGII